MKYLNMLETDLTKELFLELMPEWKDCSDINISILSGGITNKLYRVYSEKGDLVVRIYGAIPAYSQSMTYKGSR
ncbi:hypothetical protein ES703_81555 [subsurface metagenome]